MSKTETTEPTQSKPTMKVALPKSGRPLKAPPSNAADRIAAFAADGFSILGIADQLGVSRKTFERWLDDHHELKEAFDIGRENERQTLHNLLYRLATEQNDKIAAMFLLKARHGYREGDQGENANRVTINFQMPGAMPLASFTTVNDDSAT